MITLILFIIGACKISSNCAKEEENEKNETSLKNKF